MLIEKLNLPCYTLGIGCESYMRIENVAKFFNKKQENIKVLDHVTYQFEMKKMYAITGHSGSGKTTLINILGLIEPPTSGKLFIDNQDVSQMNDYEVSKLRSKKIGFIFQNYYLDENLKAYENVIAPLILNEKIKCQDRKEIAINLLKKFGLENRVNHFPKELSGGECQRVAIARAMANNPDIILADEPTGNLDEKNEVLIFEELKKLSQEGKCVIVVSHSDRVENYADVLLTIEGGKLNEKFSR